MKKFTILCVLMLWVILLSEYSYGKILFQDNFDNHPDWSPVQGKDGIECYPGHYGSYPLPPEGYFCYRIGGTIFTNPGHNTLTIDSVNHRGESGKGFTFWNESCEDYWVSDGVLDVALSQGYSELYVRFYIKFQQGWRWSTRTSPQQKFFRVAHFDRGNPFSFFSMGDSRPIFVADLCKWGGGTYPISYSPSYRYENVYYPSKAIPPHNDIDSYFFYNEQGAKKDFWDEGMPGDGNWHCWEFYFKMNSEIGVADGIHRFWQDGKLIIEDTKLSWSDKTSVVVGTDGNDYECINRHVAAESNRPITGGNWQSYWKLADSTGQGFEWKENYTYGFSGKDPRTLWNIVGIGGNNWNPYAVNEEESEQWYAIDDFVISTEYIGPDYIIGNFACDINADSKVDVLDVQLCVNVILGIETREEIVNKAKTVVLPIDTDCDVSDLQAVVNKVLGN